MKLPTKKKIGRPAIPPPPLLKAKPAPEDVGVTAKGQRRRPTGVPKAAATPGKGPEPKPKSRVVMQDEISDIFPPDDPDRPVKVHTAEETAAAHKEFARLIALYKQLGHREKCQKSFEAFLKHMWPSIIIGEHHKIMIEKLEAVERGDLKRLIINMPPRFGKSLMASEYFPMWYLGKHPDEKLMHIMHTASLSEEFGRKVRNGIQSERYQEIFPGITVAGDSKAAGRWSLNSEKDGVNRQGEAFYVGTGGALAGRGGNLINIDDPTSEQDLSDSSFESLWDWYSVGPRQRLQPKGAIVLTMCVAKGAKVLLGSGVWKNIEDVQEGELVASFDPETRKPVPRRVVAAASQGEDDILRVKSSRSDVRVNARHPFLVVRGGAAQRKTQADVIAARTWNLEWVRAGDLLPGDRVVSLKSLSKSDGHRPMLPNRRQQMTQEAYWLFGFLFGDGWLINAGSRGVTGVCVAISIYPELNAKVLKALRDVLGLNPVETKFGYWRCDSVAIGQWLHGKGFHGTAKTKRVPEWVNRLRRCDKRAFILGFVEADGWLRPSKQVDTYTVGLANRDLLNDLRLLSRTCGIRTTHISENTVLRHPPHTKEARMFTSWVTYFSFKESRHENKDRWSNQGSFATHFRFDEILSVTPDGRDEVFDLTIEGTENFIAEGFVVHNTRWSKKDLTAKLIAKAKSDPLADQWDVVELPAILPSGKPLWDYFTLEELLAVKAQNFSRWQGQYMQDPTSDDSAILKREWWKVWRKEDFQGRPVLPRLEYVMQTYDTAYGRTESSDYSAIQTWGIFHSEDTGMPCMILLSAVKERLDFPALKKFALQHYREWDPDIVVIEMRATGTSLAQELRRTGIPVGEFTPTRGNDKVARAHAASPTLESGQIYILDETSHWDLVEECASFPNGDHDDQVDAFTLAVLRFRKGGFIRLEDDDEGEELLETKAAYY